MSRSARLTLVAASLASLASGQSAVATFESLGLRWQPAEGSPAVPCTARYRALGEASWRTAHPLWFDVDTAEYRGSLVHLDPGTTYEIELDLVGPEPAVSASLQADTWPECFPIGSTATVPAFSSLTLNVDQSGTPSAWRVWQPAPRRSAVIDVDDGADLCVWIDASYVIVRGLTLRGATKHGIRLGPNAHDVVIEDCDISGWGRIAPDGWGFNHDSAIRSFTGSLSRVVVQRNSIHHPRADSNHWEEPRPFYGNDPHPRGPQAVDFDNSDGNHVIRHNRIWSDAEHHFNDILGAASNCSQKGFPGPDSDIYGNYLANCWDDAIEAEGSGANVRIWNNFVENAYVTVGVAVVAEGPLYLWRNVTGISLKTPEVQDSTRGYFMKTGGCSSLRGGRVFAYHNTLLQPPPLPGYALPMGVGAAIGNPVQHGIVTRNNVFTVFKSNRQIVSTGGNSVIACDFDYDLYHGSFTQVPAAEANGIGSVAPAYSTAPELDPTTLTATVALAAGSPGHDAALPLPGFNDAFLGLGPDVGAQETGAAPLSFGPAAYSAAYAVYCTAGTSSNGCRALLAATGRPSATASAGFQLTASGVEGGKDGLFFYGASGRQGNAWGNGTSYQCVVPPVRRGGLIAGVGAAGTCTGAFAQDLNARWCPTCSHPSHNPGVGAVVQAQLWYRDPQSTSNRSTSFSDAVEVCVQP